MSKVNYISKTYNINRKNFIELTNKTSQNKK